MKIEIFNVKIASHFVYDEPGLETGFRGTIQALNVLHEKRLKESEKRNEFHPEFQTLSMRKPLKERFRIIYSGLKRFEH